jgi:Pyruvate/2-oxoacid:ferredoxin oxidoreductase delta subunit
MEKIINIRKRLESQKHELQVKKYRKKIDTLKRITQCSVCHYKCAMCGQYLDETDFYDKSETFDYEYSFCEGCGEEFEDFLKVTGKEQGPGVFWHNKEWKRMWSTWLSHRKAIADFLDSHEFDTLLKELDSQP